MGGLRVLAWEQIDLPNGVYQVQNARWLPEIPDLAGWIDCSDNAQWSDEVDVALEMLGELRLGVWIGFGQTINKVCHGLAWIAGG
ncbi:hypothetical protein [Agrobacterium tumefaciens]|uniref:hypothetical protein n=1 Tax=Agrobacterium tumefaciens TaxID=358 RepID=UPI001573F56B|nr:hypothetical protein [Agrobacterium tumefaciens]